MCFYGKGANENKIGIKKQVSNKVNDSEAY